VLQHDAHVAADAVGGPLVLLSGKCVGVTVHSKGGPLDYESYAIPADRLRALLFDLASGRLAPR
jgi:S1-C subfamily serine protease